jgi:hypothetical protein
MDCASPLASTDGDAAPWPGVPPPSDALEPTPPPGDPQARSRAGHRARKVRFTAS